MTRPPRTRYWEEQAGAWVSLDGLLRVYPVVPHKQPVRMRACWQVDILGKTLLRRDGKPVFWHTAASAKLAAEHELAAQLQEQARKKA